MMRQNFLLQRSTHRTLVVVEKELYRAMNQASSGENAGLLPLLVPGVVFLFVWIKPLVVAC